MRRDISNAKPDHDESNPRSPVGPSKLPEPIANGADGEIASGDGARSTLTLSEATQVRPRIHFLTEASFLTFLAAALPPVSPTFQFSRLASPG